MLALLCVLRIFSRAAGGWSSGVTAVIFASAHIPGNRFWLHDKHEPTVCIRIISSVGKTTSRLEVIDYLSKQQIEE